VRLGGDARQRGYQEGKYITTHSSPLPASSPAPELSRGTGRTLGEIVIRRLDGPGLPALLVENPEPR
jgi:hypothetical protein